MNARSRELPSTSPDMARFKNAVERLVDAFREFVPISALSRLAGPIATVHAELTALYQQAREEAGGWKAIAESNAEANAQACAALEVERQKLLAYERAWREGNHEIGAGFESFADFAAHVAASTTPNRPEAGGEPYNYQRELEELERLIAFNRRHEGTDRDLLDDVSLQNLEARRERLRSEMLARGDAGMVGSGEVEAETSEWYLTVESLLRVLASTAPTTAAKKAAQRAAELFGTLQEKRDGR